MKKTNGYEEIIKAVKGDKITRENFGECLKLRRTLERDLEAKEFELSKLRFPNIFYKDILMEDIRKSRRDLRVLQMELSEFINSNSDYIDLIMDIVHSYR